MSGTVQEGGRSVKRKRATSDKRSTKRARSESSEEDGSVQILLLENEILESKKNYNNIATLVKLLELDSEDADKPVLAAISLCRIFTRLMVSGDMVKGQETTEKEAIVMKWLKERYAEYKTGLYLLLGEEEISSTALTLCMRLLKTEGEYLSSAQEYHFPTPFLTQMVKAMLKDGSDPNVRKEFSEKFVEEYDDIRFYTLEAIGWVFQTYFSVYY
jgi:U3 small nucleolar RNA-associated protein 19